MNGPIQVDPWDWWRRKLRGEPVVNDGTLHPGFYRKPHKQFYGARKTYTPVAYWPGTVNLHGIDFPTVFCRDGDTDVNETRALELWAMVHDHPVTEEAYRAVAQENKPWPDEHSLVDMRGHNLPPLDDTMEGLRDAIEPLHREAELLLKENKTIIAQEEADRIANLADRLAELDKKAEELKRLERKPHDDALKYIQKRWTPILTMAEVYKTLKYTLLTPWLQREEQRKKQEAEVAAAAGEPAAAEPRRPRVGTRGRAMTLKTQKTAEITDYKLCLEFFADSPDVRSTVQMLANRAVRAGITVPGTKVTEESKAV